MIMSICYVISHISFEGKFSSDVLVLRHTLSFTFINSINVTCFLHLKSESHNQRTNGPVSAHLISGPIRFLKVFTINEQGRHLGHVNCTIYIKFPTSQGGST